MTLRDGVFSTIYLASIRSSPSTSKPNSMTAHAASAAPQTDPVDEAVASLPAKYRAVVHLHYFEELSTVEIAAATDQRASTVRSQLTRARAMLRDMLKGGID